MGFITDWVNSYHSVMNLVQDPKTGLLKGIYSSTTGGTGTYEVVGWSALTNPTPMAGQTMAISILWRSNDGGKSDPGHEVSAMAGQVVAVNTGENLVLMHMLVKTHHDPMTKSGIYADKLIFSQTESKGSFPKTDSSNEGTGKSPAGKDMLSGVWIGKIDAKVVEITFYVLNSSEPQLQGTIAYPDGINYPIIGYTDIFACPPEFYLQGISFSTYIDEPAGRICISMAGYLSLKTNKISLTQMVSQSTPSDSLWYQVAIEQWDMVKKT